MRFVDAGFSVPRVLLLLVIVASTGPLSIGGHHRAAWPDGLAGDEPAAARRGPPAEGAGLRACVARLGNTGVACVRQAHAAGPRAAAAGGGDARAHDGDPARGRTVVSRAWRATPDGKLGDIISDAAERPGDTWWVVLFPGLAIVCTVLAVNTIGERLRERLDPGSGCSREGARAVEPRVVRAAAVTAAMTATAGVPEAPALLDVHDLVVSYASEAGSVRAVDGVSFAVHAGETVALVGESGCGKTSVAYALMRVHGVRRARGRGEPHHVRRCRPARARRTSDARPARPEDRDDLPGAGLRAQPRDEGRRAGGRGRASARGAVEAGGLGPRGRDARPHGDRRTRRAARTSIRTNSRVACASAC